MYEKNLTSDLRLRLSESDMEFLKKLSNERSSSVSEVIRSIIGEYRRNLDTLNTLNDLLTIAKERGLSNGDTESNFNN